ncbi:MAG: dimethylsulfonioproprionate lyase family protein [Hyphomicrobiaceae bacterium]
MGKKRVATRFLKAFEAVLRDKAKQDPALVKFADALKDGRDGALGKSPGARPDVAALNHLPGLLNDLSSWDDDFQDMLRATADAASWFMSYDAKDVGDTLAGGLVATQVAGKRGLLRTDTLFTGFFLIGPNVTYPLHDHVSDELYFVVSGAVDIQNGFDAEPQRITADAYSVTPSGVPHELRTGNDPVLMIYVWTGQVDCDVFWWEHTGGDNWRRFVPARTLR